MFTSNYDSRRFAACDCWTQICSETMTVDSDKQGRWRAGELPPWPFKSGKRGGGVFFLTASWIISWCIKIELKQIFLYCFLLFFRSTLLFKRRKYNQKRFVYFFMSFHCPQIFYGFPPVLPLFRHPCLIRFGNWHFRDNWGWTCTAVRMWLICWNRRLYHKKNIFYYRDTTQQSSLS